MFTPYVRPVLPYLLLQPLKERGIKELRNADVQAIAQLLHRGDRRAVVAEADDVVHRGLCDAADRAQPVDRDVPLSA